MIGTFFFSSRRRHTISLRDWSSDVCSSDLQGAALSGDYSFAGLTNNPQSPAGTGSSLAQFLLGEVSSAFIDRILGNSWHEIGRASCRERVVTSVVAV